MFSDLTVIWWECFCCFCFFHVYFWFWCVLVEDFCCWFWCCWFLLCRLFFCIYLCWLFWCCSWFFWCFNLLCSLIFSFFILVYFGRIAFSVWTYFESVTTFSFFVDSDVFWWRSVAMVDYSTGFTYFILSVKIILSFSWHFGWIPFQFARFWGGFLPFLKKQIYLGLFLYYWWYHITDDILNIFIC